MHKYLPSNKALKSRSQSLRREMTSEEKHLWYDFLKNYKIQFYRQKVIGNYIVDFYCRRAKLAVEIDGAQHYESDAAKYDLRRTEYLNSEGIAVLRFLNGDVTRRFESVCAQIDLLVRERIIPHPSPNGDTVLLRFPKISAALRLEIFDRGAKPCSLLRPLDALRKSCPKGEGSPYPPQSGDVGGFAAQKRKFSPKNKGADILRKKMIAMLLAGGQGSRLFALTKDLAKPAVPFGGKYRIIDFPLSNCVNSGIDTVGILTQYEPFELSKYIGGGQPWDLNRTGGGAFVLPPYQRSGGSDWYRGTANAIYQNLKFIERYDPKYVAVLSGDHIYKMDYSEMLEAHEKAGAACTVAVLRVPMEEASRFGILSTDEHGFITEFEEKPKNPKSDLASMGIYIFTAEKLRKYLTEDEADPDSENDFGKNVIPAMLKAGEKMAVYRFDGYWKDVGTVESLWQANMDLLDEHPVLDLYDPKWKIYSRSPVMPPHFVGNGAEIRGSMVTEGCAVYGRVLKSVLFAGVTAEAGCEISESIVMPGAVIKSGAHVERAIIGEGAVIGENAEIRGAKGKIALIAPNETVGEGEKR